MKNKKKKIKKKGVKKSRSKKIIRRKKSDNKPLGRKIEIQVVKQQDVKQENQAEPAKIIFPAISQDNTKAITNMNKQEEVIYPQNQEIQPEESDFEVEPESWNEEVLESPVNLESEDLYPLYEEETEEVEEIESAPGLNSQQKIIILYTSVFSVMIVIAGFWFFSVKNSWGNNINEQNNTSGIFNTNSENMPDVRQLFTDIEQNINDIKKQEEYERKAMEISNEALKNGIKEKVKDQTINQIKEQILNLPPTPNL